MYILGAKLYILGVKMY